MKKFLIYTVSLIGIVVFLMVSTLIFIPIDNNDYLCEFAEKIKLIKQTRKPRIIFLGGSNLAFGLDSRRIQDSLGVNVINMGLHAGIGMRFAMRSIESYIRRGDIIVLAVEYSNFYNDGCDGNSQTLTNLMLCSHWKGFCKLTFTQMLHVLAGIPVCSWYNLNRLKVYLKTKSWNSSSSKEIYSYQKSGFNKYGDEESHWNLKSNGVPNFICSVDKWKLNNSFLKWYFNEISLYKKKGAAIFMLPPSLAQTSVNKETIKIHKLIEIMAQHNIPYVISPYKMAVPDSMMYNTDYHCAKGGVILNTNRIISIMSVVMK